MGPAKVRAVSVGVWTALAVALILAVLAGLAAAIETALRVINPTRAELLKETGKPGALRVYDMAVDPAPYVNTVLFLRLACEIFATVLTALVVFDHIGPTWARILTAGGSMLLVSFIVWGVAPRTLGRQHALTITRIFSGPISILKTVLGPIPQILILIGNALTPGRGYADGPFASEAELRAMVDMAEERDVIEDDERRMIHSVFELGDTIVREVMVPRTDMVTIESTKTLRQALSLALRSGFSRIPVVTDSVDDVVGVLYLKDLMRRVYDNMDGQTHEQVDTVMRPAVWCPDSRPARELLEEMQRTRTHMVMVGDEFGGLAGLITIEDILEEIVGEIVDEYDDEIPPVTQLAPGRYRVSSRLGVDELGELYGLRVDDDDVETVGGLMAKLLSRVPIAGSVVEWEGLELTAERASGRRKQHRTILVSSVGHTDEAVAAAAGLATDGALAAPPLDQAGIRVGE